MLDLGTAIRKARALRGVSQEDLNRMTGLSCTAFIETGRRVPSLRVLEMISKALRIPTYLLVLMATPRSELGHLDRVATETFTKHLLDLVLAEPPVRKNKS